MIFISKQIRDPNMFLPSNRMGRTVGLVLRTPKFWNCRRHKWNVEPHPSFPDWYTDLEREHAARHSNCRWPHRHMSYRGYLYFHGPKRRYQLNYMGDVNPHNSNHPWFFVQPHSTYTRWFDNGPQNPERDDAEVEEMRAMLRATRDLHKQNGCLFMSAKFADCICPKDRA